MTLISFFILIALLSHAIWSRKKNFRMLVKSTVAGRRAKQKEKNWYEKLWKKRKLKRKINCRWLWKLFHWTWTVSFKFNTQQFHEPLRLQKFINFIERLQKMFPLLMLMLFLWHLTSYLSARWKLEREKAFYCHWRDRTFVMAHKVEWSTFFWNYAFHRGFYYFFFCFLSFFSLPLNSH